jgi:CHAT domain
MASGKILFFAANPSETTQLELGEEARDIEQKIRASTHRDFFTLKTQWATTADDLLQAMSEHLPGVVHFSGHGNVDPPGIVLHRPKGGYQLVSADALRSLFESVGDNVRVVVLNACHSEAQARAIAEIVDCVVGMKGSVDDAVARTFAASFYRALGFGRSVQNAFAQGVAAIKLQGLGEEEIPTLCVKRGARAEKIVLVPSSAWEVRLDSKRLVRLAALCGLVAFSFGVGTTVEGNHGESLAFDGSSIKFSVR